MDPITQRILDQQRAITQDPNFSGYQPSSSSLDQDMMSMQNPANGIAGLNNAPVNEDLMLQNNLVGQTPPVDFKGMAKNVGKKLVTDYAIKKLGLDGIRGNLLKSAVGSNLAGFSNPLTAAFTVGSLLPDSVKGIAGILRNNRAQKAIERDILRDMQGSRDTTTSARITNMQPTNQDRGRNDRPGGANNTASSSPSRGTGGFDSSERGAALHG